MANLYLFFDKRRPSPDGRGTVKIALSHRHKTVYQSLDIHVKPDEWDAANGIVVKRADKKFLNIEIRKMLSTFDAGLSRVERRRDYMDLTARDIIDMITRGAETVDSPADLDYVMPVYNEYITLCKKTSTAQVYKSSLNNLIEYCEDIDSLRFKDINVSWLRKYQQWLSGIKGMSDNGANVYLRNLRTIFNYAIKNEFTTARYPFRDIDMTTAEPDKRLIPYEKFIEWATMPMPDFRNFYRDLFMLSFYLCGIRPIDLLHVKKSQVQDGRLVYCPEKLNGRTKLSIKIEPEAWEIIRRNEGKEYLLGVMESRTDYKEFSKHWNRAIRAIGHDEVGLKTGRGGRDYTTVLHHGLIPYITVYYARTCWASYAYNVLDIPMDVISQALGHKSGVKVTNFYVKRDTKKVDVANRRLIDKVKADMERFKSAQEGLITP